MDSIKIIENGQENNVSLICYFTSNNNNYLFFTKNETVQNGLIKMYVAKENNTESITDDEWANLKKDMQDIIMNKSNVTFLKYSSTLTLDQNKAIALNQDNINSISNVYKNSNLIEIADTGTNKDLLAGSFGAPQVEPIPGSIEASPQPIETIDNFDASKQPMISEIPSVKNTLDMESTPISLDPLGGNNNPDTSSQGEALTINNVNPPISDSGFKVSDEPNIFDNPGTPSPTEPVSLEAPIIAPTTEAVKEEPQAIDPVVEIPSMKPIETSTDEPLVPIDIAPNQPSPIISGGNKQIELNERKIKAFEELANIFREENELLSGEDELEKTASNLFDNNGSLGNI